MKITWPSPQDYNEAIQSPRLAFLDDELRTAQVELNSLGLPKPSSGNFATVYQMANTQQSWAVRCFVQAAYDLELRYQKISAELAKNVIAEAVSFQYLPNGIQVSGRRFPLLKMEWVNGVGLDNFVRCHHKDSAIMHSLAQRFVKLCMSLRQRGLAHGDLQHGNILVSANGLRLIDYDGMYVPAMAGAAASENGHRHYQHPLRAAAQFNNSLDNFSTWVIFISLNALALDPSLWSQLDAGDECLLFRSSDFLAPEQSKAFAKMTQHENKSIQSLAMFFRTLCQLTPDRLPPLHQGLLDGADYTNLHFAQLVEQSRLAPAPVFELREDSSTKNSTDSTRPSSGNLTSGGTSHSGNITKPTGSTLIAGKAPLIGNQSFDELIDKATAAFTIGRSDEAEHYFARAIQHSKAAAPENKHSFARALVQSGFCYISMNQPEAATKILTRAFFSAKQIDDYHLEVHAQCGLGLASAQMGDFANALVLLKQIPSPSDLRSAVAVLLKGPLGERVAFADLLWSVAEHYFEQKDLNYAARFCDCAIEAYFRSVGPDSEQIKRCKQRKLAMEPYLDTGAGRDSWKCNYCLATNINKSRKCYSCRMLHQREGACRGCGGSLFQCTCAAYS